MIRRLLIVLSLFVTPTWATTHVADSFVRPDGPLGSCWKTFGLTPGEGVATASGGDINISSHAYGPVNAKGGDAISVFSCGSYGANQYATATISTIAANTSTISISAAVQSAGSTTFTYTLTQGAALFLTQAIIISGMADAGNNVECLTTVLGAGTFTCVNATGVTRAGQTGTGVSPSDSNAGLCVRCTPDGQNGYFLIAGTNSFSLNGSLIKQQYDVELWKVVNGVVSQLKGAASSSISDSPGDRYALWALGSTLHISKNGVENATFLTTDTDLSSGSPGTWSWSVSGPHEYDWSNWGNSAIMGSAPGNNGTTWTNWEGGSLNGVPFVTFASDPLTEGTITTPILTDAFPYANGTLHTLNASWVQANGGSFQVSSNKVFGSSGSTSFAYRNDTAWPPDQCSQITVVVGGTLATQQNGVAVRINPGATTAFIVRVASDTFDFLSVVAASFANQHTSSQRPVTGDVVKLCVNGVVISTYLNGVIVPELSGSTIGATTGGLITTGNPGLFAITSSTTNGASSWTGSSFTDFPMQFTSIPAGAYFSDTTKGGYANTLTASGFTAKSYQNTVTWTPTQFSQATMSGATNIATQDDGPGVRMTTAVNNRDGYWFGPQGTTGTASIFKQVSGSVTILGSVTYAYNSGDVFRLEVDNKLLEGYINGTPVIMEIDSSISSGSAGLYSLNTIGSPTGSSNGTFTTWSGGGLPGGTMTVGPTKTAGPTVKQ